MDGTRVRFILSDIHEDEIKDEMGFYAFEPTVTLEIEGKNVIEKFGERGVKSVIIADSIEGTFVGCKRMAGLFERVLSIFTEGEFSFAFNGTGVVINLQRDGDELEVSMGVDSIGPVGNLKYGDYHLGRVTVVEWIQAVVNLAKEVRDLFKRHNPRLYAIIKKEWFQIGQLESWLANQ
ncbi:MAG: hypothetical protein E3J35_06425 [Methanomassiliicoccales archaeon]|nr:MAG: hypothetical protein E3J35_06425 [Methanomassiliicoccales archaeon]